MKHYQEKKNVFAIEIRLDFAKPSKMSNGILLKAERVEVSSGCLINNERSSDLKN